MAKWMHLRKGLITGEVVHHEEGSVWTHIRLVGDHTLRGTRGPQQWEDGDILVVRAEFLAPVADDE